MIQVLGAVNSKIVNGQLFTMRKDILNQSLESTVFYIQVLLSQFRFKGNPQVVCKVACDAIEGSAFLLWLASLIAEGFASKNERFGSHYMMRGTKGLDRAAGSSPALYAQSVL